jgi:hypothetical protein
MAARHEYKFFEAVEKSFDKATPLPIGIRVCWNRLSNATRFIACSFR